MFWYDSLLVEIFDLNFDPFLLLSGDFMSMYIFYVDHLGLVIIFVVKHL